MHFNFKMNCISFNEYLAQFLSKDIYLFLHLIVNALCFD